MHHIEWHRVTWYSWVAAILVFLGTFIVAFNLGILWEKVHVETALTEMPAPSHAGGAAGARCGGFVKDAPTCAEGFRCQLDVSRPDTGGICVPDETAGKGVAPYQSGVTGVVNLGPTCPVEQDPPAAGCADTPYETTVAIFRASDPAHPYAIGKSAADGTFSFSVPPGDYTLGAGESALPHCAHPSVTVPSVGYATTTIECDTGIR